MSQCEPARIAPRRHRLTVLTALAFVSAGLIGVVAGPSRMTPGEADGVLRVGVTVFDDDSPAVTNLDPDLLRALRQAAKDAAKNRIAIVVNSGWRSVKYQEHLLTEAVAKYGSAKKAARWVATTETSLHVSGDAVDVGPSAAAMWLSKRGVAYGLCRIYKNEPWHFELRREATKHGCPSMYASPAEAAWKRDSRMHQ